MPISSQSKAALELLKNVQVIMVFATTLVKCTCYIRLSTYSIIYDILRICTCLV